MSHYIEECINTLLIIIMYGGLNPITEYHNYHESHKKDLSLGSGDNNKEVVC